MNKKMQDFAIVVQKLNQARLNNQPFSLIHQFIEVTLASREDRDVVCAFLLRVVFSF